MAIRGDFLTTQEVSDLLGVEARQVRALAETGSITRVARGIFDRTSVERYRAERGSRLTRTWAERTAWGAIAMLSGAAPRDLGDVQTYRLRATLREITDPAELAIRLRDRATVTTWSGHRSVIGRVREELVVPGRQRLGLVEDETVVDGYIHADLIADLVRRCHLGEDSTGSITLRYTHMDIDFINYLSAFNRTLAAVDAATSLDPRERGVGEQVLNRRLELFRENVRP
ncbi:type IV toxin-antitoxin system AbiEi family antitoxin domain-containing protein [Nocardioides sp. NPDC051685]|uniref:type IV toxin-antitoxin system AbiEi family antitoxin domain-containing protein n=1 Tax=Nocardioides sp. NPDC051685 TaxID=3364334 RepID=UPI00378DD06F